MADYIGTFSIVRQAKPVNRWQTPGVPSYDPNWVLKFYLPGRPVQVKSGPKEAVFPICERCLALPAECGGVMKMRESCKCQVWPRKWAVEFLRTQTHLIMMGEMHKLEAMRRPDEWTPLAEVLAVYEQRGPADARKRVSYLRKILEVATGKPMEKQTWHDLTKNVCFDFAELWQEAGRRGWLERGTADGWLALREEFKAGRLPALDTRTVMKCNTSIRNYLNAARSIFGPKSRDTFLRGLALPRLEGFMETTIAVRVPKGHRRMTAEDLQVILEALPKLKETRPSVWLANRMMMRFGLRPEEVWWAKLSWLEQTKTGRTRLVLINREDVTLKAGADAKERRFWVPDEELTVMREVATETALIGGRNITEARDFVEREHPQWLKSLGLNWERPNYMFRHFNLAEVWTSRGATQAAAMGGHASTKTTEENYATNLATLEPLSEEEIGRRLGEDE